MTGDETRYVTKGSAGGPASEASGCMYCRLRRNVVNCV